MSLADRTKFGLIQLFFSAIIGCMTASLGFLISHPPHFNLSVFILTLMFFFALGATLKERASDFFAMCLQAFWLFLNISAQNLHYQADNAAFSPRTCLLLLLGYAGVVLLLLTS